MKIGIKNFSVEMEVKNKGIEFEVRNNQDEFLGDLVVTKTGVTWCEGRTQVKNGQKVAWEDLIKIFNDLKDE